MPRRRSIAVLALVAAVLGYRQLFSVAAAAAAGMCELSVVNGGSLYNYSLAAPVKGHPHGALSEDGFYKVRANTTFFLWFQLCDLMIFNHDPPSCFGCQDCGGPLHCGTKCTALLATDIGGYYVCKAVGQESRTTIFPIDGTNLQKGVVVKLSYYEAGINCSLAVSVFCDRNNVQLPDTVDALDACVYATTMRHPSGCPKIISLHGAGLGWFFTLLIIISCMFVGYLLAGTVYRFYLLGIRGPETIPNLELWRSLPGRVMVSSRAGGILTRTWSPWTISVAI